MVNADPPSLGGTGAPRNAPAPWVPYTRAGCDVGGVGLANIEQENNTSIVLRTTPAPTSLAAAANPGDTNIKVNSVNGLAAGQVIVLDNAQVANELATILSVGTAGAGGTGVNLTAGLTKAHASGAQVNVTAPDPTGDMTKVFGVGSPEWNEGRASQISPANTAARSARTDRLRRHRGPLRSRRRHLQRQLGQRAAGPAARRAGGYNGFEGLFGAKYVDPAISGRTAAESVGDVVNGTSRSPTVRPAGLPGLRRHARQRPRWATSRRCRRPACPSPTGTSRTRTTSTASPATIHRAFGPGEAGLRPAAAGTTTGVRGSSSTACRATGSQEQHAVRVHGRGGRPLRRLRPRRTRCDGVTTPCTYNIGHVGEVNGDLAGWSPPQRGQRDVGDDELQRSIPTWRRTSTSPAIPPVTPPVTRNLERGDVEQLHVTNPLHGSARAHYSSRSPIRWRKSATHGHGRSGTDTDVHAVRGERLFPQRLVHDAVREQRPLELRLRCPTTAPPNQTFAWNHGGIQPEIRSTWLGLVGPGVAKNGEAQQRLLGPITPTSGRRCSR